MATAKPTIVFIPGAWHTPAHYEDLLSLLEKAGYETKAIQLPSVGSDSPNEQSVVGDAQAIREQLLLPLLDAGRDILLVMHSYGGCPGGAAAKNLSKSARTTSGGIVGLVFIAALLAAENSSLLSSLPGCKFDPWVIVNEEMGQLDVEKPADVFYHDAPEEKKLKAVAALKPHSRNTLSSPSPPPGWADEGYNGRRGYIHTLQDRTIPVIAQKMMVQYSGVEWNIMEIDTSHSPFLVHPQQLADDITEMATAFEAK